MPRPTDAKLSTATSDELLPMIDRGMPNLGADLFDIVGWANSPIFRVNLMRASGFPLDDLPAFLVVQQLILKGAQRPTDLADSLQIDRSNLSKVLGRLEETGLVKKTPDPHDSRAILVALTDSGRALGYTILELGFEALRDFFVEWDEEEFMIFQRLLSKASRSISRMSDGFTPPATEGRGLSWSSWRVGLRTSPDGDES